MAKLLTGSRFANPDAAYVALVEARRGLSAAAAADLDARPSSVRSPDVTRLLTDVI